MGRGKGRLLTVDAAALMYSSEDERQRKIFRDWLYRIIREEKLRHFKEDRKIMIWQQDFEDYIEGNIQEVEECTYKLMSTAR